MQYYHRLIETKLKKYLKTFPAVGITGPRQSGKSTLLRHQLGDKYQYVTFDHQPTVDLFYDDPERFIHQYTRPVIFDEVQKVPEIFNFIKIQIDNDRRSYGRYILTGSSQFSFIHKITESLAGRMGVMQLLPFHYKEIPQNLRKYAIYKGSYPELINHKYENSQVWYLSYLTTYLEKDVRSISNIGDIRDFSRFIRILAANTSQLLNMSNYAKDLGVSVPTIKRWLSILEASYIIFLLPPYYKNLGKRIVKSPKVYFVDTGLVAYLTHINSEELYQHGPMKGALFENYVVSEIYKNELLQDNPAELSFYRTSHGDEVDMIIDRFTNKELIEIKVSETFKPNMMKTINKLISKNDLGRLIYNGESMPYDKNIKIQNVNEYFDSM